MYVHVGIRVLSQTQKFGRFVPIVPYSPDSEKELSLVWRLQHFFFISVYELLQMTFKFEGPKELRKCLH